MHLPITRNIIHRDMYAKRIQLNNYGPVESLDIVFPFEGETPKPVVLVGENGSGKSILLSHLVNGLVIAKDHSYPETPEMETEKVYKLRDNSYIKLGREYYFSNVEFEDGMFVRELRTRHEKQKYVESMPEGLYGENAVESWGEMENDAYEHFDESSIRMEDSKAKSLISNNCILYFPANRFEEPAWLNEKNLKSKAEYNIRSRMMGETTRSIINYSSLRENQNWLFDLAYDQTVFDWKTLPFEDGNKRPGALRVYRGGGTMNIFLIARQVVQNVIRNDDVGFRIGRRFNRVVSVESNSGNQSIVPNIFQLSSGETSLLDIFLSILRDFDLCDAQFSNVGDIRGIVVVDEIDLHLHAVHQYDILPRLIQMFPKVQFIVTTHSPLFVLGMNKVFGENGFALYRLPHGRQIHPEEFSEFEDAYQAFSDTVKFSEHVRSEISDAQNPILFMEGKTDVKYIHKAACVLGYEDIIDRIKMVDGGGGSNLKKLWGTRILLSEISPRKVLFLHDCDSSVELESDENMSQCSIPYRSDNPIGKGIENLFTRETIERARNHKPAFIDIKGKRTKTIRGKKGSDPEEWTVNDDEKSNLCDWICENGSPEDFQGFQVIFRMIQDTLLADGVSSGS